ncbi:MAG: hypothetical protein AWL62_2355 [Halanaerobium sp. T82-1]|nr:MAG: hypothetical protein AWL62_2355 [Halanaerobium sp. T82-1]
MIKNPLNYKVFKSATFENITLQFPVILVYNK